MICRSEPGPIAAAVIAAAALGLAGCNEPAPEQPTLEQAIAALDEGDGFSAELSLRELLTSGTPSEGLSAYLGQAELLQGQPVEARRWLGEGRFSPETAGRGFHMLGRLEMAEGNLVNAGRAFDRALAATPRDPRLWTDIGRLRYRGGEHTLALEAAAKAIAFGPHEHEALLFRAQLTRDSEGMVAALPWFERAIAAGGAKPELLAEYAATLGEAGKPLAMLGIVRQIAATDPAFPRVYFLQAAVAARAGDYRLARKLLARSGQPVTDTPAGLLLSGVIDLESGNHASAAQQLDRLYRQQPENRRVRNLLARALAMSGGHRELIQRFGASARLPSASPYLQTLVARSHEALGNRAEAAEFIDLAARKRSGNLVALGPAVAFADSMMPDRRSGMEIVALVRSRISEGRTREAANLANGFLRRYPGSADAFALAGDAELADDNVTRAATMYRQSAAIRQSWPLARRRIAALNAAGQSGEADRLLRSFVAGHPLALEPTILLAKQEYERGNHSLAARLLDHALVAGANRDPDVLALRAAVGWHMGDTGLARLMAERAIAVQPTHKAALQVMALTSNRDVASVLLAKLERLNGGMQVASR